MRKTRQINESIKLGLNNYCSSSCQREGKNNQKLVKCENPNCQKSLYRKASAVSRHNFCNHSCAALVLNRLRQPKLKRCSGIKCQNFVPTSKKYCSQTCIPSRVKYTKEILTQYILHFAHANKRIPTKKEFNAHWYSYKLQFGTWNNAIKSAQLSPNQCRFTHKYLANDGHVCDSLSEKIIDDWLLVRKITHQKSIYYPDQNKFKTDFLVNGKYWIEFLGLKNELKSYDLSYKRKLEIAEKGGIKIIELFPGDLFPINRLSEKLGFLL